MRLYQSGSTGTEWLIPRFGARSKTSFVTPPKWFVAGVVAVMMVNAITLG
jgi:hypothetical protein